MNSTICIFGPSSTASIRDGFVEELLNVLRLGTCRIRVVLRIRDSLWFFFARGRFLLVAAITRRPDKGGRENAVQTLKVLRKILTGLCSLLLLELVHPLKCVITKPERSEEHTS